MTSRSTGPERAGKERSFPSDNNGSNWRQVFSARFRSEMLMSTQIGRNTEGKMEVTMWKGREAKSEAVHGDRGWVSRVGGFTCLPLIAIAVACSSLPAEAHVTKLVITENVPFAGGQEFGTVGAYARLKGSAYFEVDPRDPLNAVITDIHKAPQK